MGRRFTHGGRVDNQDKGPYVSPGAQKIRPLDDAGHVTVFQAMRLLPPRKRSIHTWLAAGPAAVGCDWSRQMVRDSFEKNGPRLSGPQMRAMGHGLAVIDRRGTVFVETRKDFADLCEPQDRPEESA